jgi:hypothetical protein
MVKFFPFATIVRAADLKANPKTRVPPADFPQPRAAVPHVHYSLRLAALCHTCIAPRLRSLTLKSIQLSKN